MAQRIDYASKFQYNVNAGPDATKLNDFTEDINRASGFLSTNVEKMIFELGSLVSSLKKAQLTVEKERSLAERILGWLKSLFKAISTVSVALTRPISRIVRHHSDPKVEVYALDDTPLRQGASDIWKGESGAFIEHIILLQEQK